MYRINYHHLFLFYTIAQEGSIAKAGKKLLLAQPTLSMQLRQLEKHLNRELFVRKNRRLLLTDEGRIVLRYAEAIFQLGRELADDLQDRPARGSHSIQVGVVNGIPPSFTCAMLNCILERSPLAQITCREASLDQLLLDLREYRFDIILSDDCVSAGAQAHFNSLRIGKIPVLLAAKPALAKRYSRLPHALDGAPLLLPRVPADVYRQLQVYFSKNKVKPRIVAEVQDVEVACRLAISGFGIAPLPQTTFALSRPSKALAAVGRGYLPGIYDSLYLITFADRLRLNPLAKMLLSRFRLQKPSSTRVTSV